MYLVHIPMHRGEDAYLFFHEDPLAHGCTFPILEGVELQGLTDSGEWQMDMTDPGECSPFVLARSQRSPKTFKLCRSGFDVPQEFDVVTNNVEVWAD